MAEKVGGLSFFCGLPEDELLDWWEIHKEIVQKETEAYEKAKSKAGRKN